MPHGPIDLKDMDHFAGIPVTALGVLVAIAFTVTGAPLYAIGRRALRLRRVLGGLVERPITTDASGWLIARGRISLVSPLFAPLSGRRCAAFRLEVCGENSRVGGVVGDCRSFRIEHDGASALVSGEGASWSAPVTEERALVSTEPMPERVAELLATCPETRWLRDRRASLHVVERALEAGAMVSVLGLARVERSAVRAEKLALAATGTDDALSVEVEAGPEGGASNPELWLAGDDELSPGVRVSTEPLDRRALEPSPWLLALLGLGPALTLFGLLYLAWAAGPLVVGRL